jgi:lipopolysaccharide transport system ATP-binding protein
VSQPLIAASDLTKILCKDLRRSLLYGTVGVARELLGRSRQCDVLRPGEFRALDRVSFELRQGESLGLVGRNGAGKTTLLRVVSGLLTPDGGRVTVRGRIGALIALGAGFNPVLTGRENIFVNAAVLGLSRAETLARFDAIVAFAEVAEFIDAPLHTYSSGMQARLGFSVAAQLEPDILLIDEVLAVGDVAFRAKCYRRINELMAAGTAIVFVSHQAQSLLSVCKSGLLLERGRVAAAGPIEDVLRRYEESLAQPEPDEQVGAGPARKSMSELTIERISLHDAEGLPADTLQTGRPGSIRVRCRSSRAFERAAAGVIIRRVGGEGEPLVHVDGGREGMWLSIPEGTTDLALQMPHVALMPGRYRAKVFVARARLDYLDIIESFTFVVTSAGPVGSAEFHQAGRWEVLARAQEAGA